MSVKASVCVALFVAFCALTPSATKAQAPPTSIVGCPARDVLLERLKDKFQEAPIALGTTHNRNLVEVLVSTLKEGEVNTWSIIVTTPEGMSCLVSSGVGWKTRKKEAPNGSELGA